MVLTDNSPNNASWLVSHSLKLLPRHTFIISYADIEGWGHVGKVYQACHFYYTGTTKSRTDKYSEGHSRHYADNETRRQYRTAKYRYVYFVGNRTDKRMMAKELMYPIYPEYPKGTSQRYDVQNPKPLIGGKNKPKLEDWFK